MPTRDTAPTGAPCWMDLMTSDPDRSREFYTQLFGWTADEPQAEFGGYWQFRRDGVAVGGGMRTMAGAGSPDVWSVYLAADDAQKTVDTAEANGGQIYSAPMAVGDLGTMAMLADSGGAAVGTWQPGSFNGFEVLGENGAPSWFELQTRDYDGAVAFYRDVFGWETSVVSNTPEFRYTVLQRGEEQYAGIMDASGYLPEGVPSHWEVYLGTDDTDATLEQAVALGGSVVEPAADTPFGRIAVIADPTGAQFKLVAPNEAMPAR